MAAKMKKRIKTAAHDDAMIMVFLLLKSVERI